MRIRLPVRILVVNYLIAALMVGAFYLSHTTKSTANDLYGVLFLGLIPILGGVNGLFMSKYWGHLKSAVGKSIVFLSLGLISWGLGTYIYSGYYNFIQHIQTPYPSFADIGYLLALPLWLIGMIELAKASGFKYGTRSLKGKAMLLVVPIVVIAVSYYLLVAVARGGDSGISPPANPELSTLKELCVFSYCIPKLFFDLVYPIGDVVILTMATLVYALSFKYFGGIYKAAIHIILAGFILMYISDFSFSYITNFGESYPGNWVDFLFTTSVFTLSIGVAMLDPRRIHEQK